MMIASTVTSLLDAILVDDQCEYNDQRDDADNPLIGTAWRTTVAIIPVRVIVAVAISWLVCLNLALQADCLDVAREEYGAN